MADGATNSAKNPRASLDGLRSGERPIARGTFRFANKRRELIKRESPVIPSRIARICWSRRIQIIAGS